MRSPILDPGIGTVELPDAPPTEGETEHTPGDAGADFGRCPVCGKFLHPHDPETGVPRTPPIGKGFSSRAKCTGCGVILYYCGDKVWSILLDSDLTDEDRALDKIKW